MQNHAIHYEASNKYLGTMIKNGVCPVVSAGHTQHAKTTASSWPAIK